MKKRVLILGAGFGGMEVATSLSEAHGAALRFFLTRLHDWEATPAGALVRPKDPLEYVRKLRFHQNVGSVRDYGLAA